MVLKFSFGKAEFTTAEFYKFRSMICDSAGIEMIKMVAFGGTIKWDKKDPLTALLYHSDHDGSLTKEQCTKIIPVLKTMITKWEKGNQYREKGLQLVKGMEAAVAAKKSLDFITK